MSALYEQHAVAIEDYGADAHNRTRGICAAISHSLFFTHHLHDDALLPLTIELGIEDLLPRAEIELAVGDGQNHLMTHDRALQMRVGIVLAGLMMTVGKTGRGDLLEPHLKVVDETVLPIVHVDAGRDVHR